MAKEFEAGKEICYVVIFACNTMVFYRSCKVNRIAVVIFDDMSFAGAGHIFAGLVHCPVGHAVFV